MCTCYLLLFYCVHCALCTLCALICAQSGAAVVALRVQRARAGLEIPAKRRRAPLFHLFRLCATLSHKNSMFTRLLKGSQPRLFFTFFYIVAAYNPSADDNNVDAQRSTHTSVHILLMRARAARKLERLWARRPWLLQEGRMLAGKMSFFPIAFTIGQLL